MATKKASKNVAAEGGPAWSAWLFALGFLVSGILAAVGFVNVWVSVLLALVAIITAIVFLDAGDFVNFGIAFLVLSAVAGAFGGPLDSILPGVGGAVSAFFTGVAGFFAVAALTLFIEHTWRRYIAPLMG